MIQIMTDSPQPKVGRPKKEEKDKVKPLNLKLSPPLMARLERIRGSRKWPATLEDLATRYEKETEAPF